MSDLGRALEDLQELTARLRRECPWDREQTARTIVPHTVEEAYEVADAAIARDDARLADELGDLLFQVYFLALLLEERGATDLGAVARNVHAKLVRRHPHVFGDAEARTAGRVRERWDQIKARAGQNTSVCVVGDTPADIFAAKAVGIPVIAVATGTYTRNDLLKFAPDSCVESCVELLAALPRSS